jgi:hypothetical protein
MMKWIKAKSSFSNSNCVEVARAGSIIVVRNSRNPSGVPLAFTKDEWVAFVGGVKGGEFDGLVSAGS